ncbi:hypothetical protein AAMO2058_000568500 [Amorphochlora amoebiformis]
MEAIPGQQLETGGIRTMAMRMNVEGFYHDINKRLQLNMEGLKIMHQDFALKADVALNATEATRKRLLASLHSRLESHKTPVQLPKQEEAKEERKFEEFKPFPSDGKTEMKDKKDSVIRGDANLNVDLNNASHNANMREEKEKLQKEAQILSEVKAMEELAMATKNKDPAILTAENARYFARIAAEYSDYSLGLREDLAAIMTITAPDLP